MEVVIDYETIDIRTGLGSTEYYLPTFRVGSAAFSWFNAAGDVCSTFIEGEDAVGAVLRRYARLGYKMIAHNIQFEIGVTRCRFPDIPVNWFADTMRLVQNYDMGGKNVQEEVIKSIDDLIEEATLDSSEETAEDKKGPRPGLSLEASISRILPKQFHAHKSPAHTFLIQTYKCKKGDVGAYLPRLPYHMAKEYNCGDTENTLRLYHKITEDFKKENFNWQFDHMLYLHSVGLIVSSKIAGVRIDRPKLTIARDIIAAEIKQIENGFTDKFKREIKAVERARALIAIRKRKTLKGRKRFIRRVRDRNETAWKDVRFNVGSNTQLALLFVDQLGFKAKFLTAKGAPSFKSSMLSQWGDGGEILQKRRKRLLILKQITNLLALSEFDSRWHIDLKAAGTASGRMAGGSY